MGKRIRVQRRGRGGSQFQASTHKRVSSSKYPNLGNLKNLDKVKGEILDFVHDPGRGAPLAHIKLESGYSYYSIIPEGAHKGQTVEIGPEAAVKIGNVITMGNIPEGTMVCNIELSPGDGGKMIRSSGNYATVISHTPEGTMVKLPSGKTRYINDSCLAMIGVVSAAGRTEKAFLKAGSKYHLMKAKGQKYPRTRGRAMVAAVHPFGSGRRGARKVSTVGRNAPPGRKVGLIAARRAGRKKKK